MNRIKKEAVLLLKKTELLSAVAVRLTKITKKSEVPIHPKHLLDKNPWYLKFLDKNDILLDLGCHNGQNTIKSSRLVKKAIGVELDDKAINLAKSSSKNLKIKNISFKKANLENKLQFKDKSFTKILFLDVLEHLNGREKILNEIHRILKNDGQVILGVPNNQTSWKKLQKSAGICYFSDPDHKVEFSKKSIENLLEKTRFKITYFGYGKYDTPLKGIIDVIGAFSLSLYWQITLWRTKKVWENPLEASGFEIVAKKQ